MKPKLLVIELWGVGDLAIGSPFLRKAAEQFDVTLVAKPYALDLQRRFLPTIRVMPFNAPWTAFAKKYRLLSWPWGELARLIRNLRRERFDFALSARWDPRDHFLLRLSGARTRLGFPRTGSQIFLNRPLAAPPPAAHRYENWRIIAGALGLALEDRSHIQLPSRPTDANTVCIHTGAGQPVRVWPLEHYCNLIRHLRSKGLTVRVLCNSEQRDWWIVAGEPDVRTPRTITEMLDDMNDAAVFIGNDSGPGHLAAFSGIPTFTFFGPQLSEWFVPFHPASEWIDGKACPYKPCSDYCRFPVPQCLQGITEEEVLPIIDRFIEKNVKNLK